MGDQHRAQGRECFSRPTVSKLGGRDYVQGPSGPGALVRGPCPKYCCFMSRPVVSQYGVLPGKRLIGDRARQALGKQSTWRKLTQRQGTSFKKKLPKQRGGKTTSALTGLGFVFALFAVLRLCQVFRWNEVWVCECTPRDLELSTGKEHRVSCIQKSRYKTSAMPGTTQHMSRLLASCSRALLPSVWGLSIMSFSCNVSIDGIVCTHTHNGQLESRQEYSNNWETRQSNRKKGMTMDVQAIIQRRVDLTHEIVEIVVVMLVCVTPQLTFTLQMQGFNHVNRYWIWGCPLSPTTTS